MLSPYKSFSFIRAILVRVPPTTFVPCGLRGNDFLSFWPFGPSFPFILALLFRVISFHFSFLGLYFLAFPFILAFWASISFYFGFFGPSFPFILAFWAFISFHFWLVWAATWGLPHKLPKTARILINLNKVYQRRNRLHFAIFGLLGFHFLSFWSFGPSFSFILAFWVFISFHFGLLGFHFLSFWSFGPSKMATRPDLAQNCNFPFKFCNFSFSKICGFGLSFWPFEFSFPFILAFWPFISFDCGLLGLHFL